MSEARAVTMILTKLEAAHIADLVAQFSALLTDDSAAAASDPARKRLAPDAYRDDERASSEFRRLTQEDMFRARADDAERVSATLREGGVSLTVQALDRVSAELPHHVELDPITAQSWLRTLNALRLVMAERLDIHTDDDHDPHSDDDPRFGIYDWLGYRLDMLVSALDQA